ncbi:hypothetical protein PR048_030676 [Dryococelus australis]|uniref:Uncharacterized protein n=1 Tax=Dryococelus australis TaxID=614101 RepID=A0ABQ9G9L0_9NEOP|nr:hypothetical protein PR048_030676 [Dryococelus australis]
MNQLRLRPPVRRFANHLPTGAAVAQGLKGSRAPTKASQVLFPAGSLQDIRSCESCGTMPLVGGFSRESPDSSRPCFSRAVSYSPRFTLIGSQGLDEPPKSLTATLRGIVHMKAVSIWMASPVKFAGRYLRFIIIDIQYLTQAIHCIDIGIISDKIDVKHVYIEVDFVIRSQFIRHALDDSEPIADWKGNKTNEGEASGVVLRSSAGMRGGRGGDPRKIPSSSGFVRHNSHVRRREILLRETEPEPGAERVNDKIDFKREYTEFTFAIGSEFIRDTLDGSAPIADLQGYKKRIPYCQLYGGNTPRHARRSDEALDVRVTVARIAPPLLDLVRAAT